MDRSGKENAKERAIRLNKTDTAINPAVIFC